MNNLWVIFDLTSQKLRVDISCATRQMNEQCFL